MKIELINHTPNPELLVAQSAKLCYSSVGVKELTGKLTDEEVERFIRHLIDIGHESPLEHASFTFAVECVSRSLLAQLTRHRISSFSVQSQRYVSMNNPDFIVPDSIQKDNLAYYEFNSFMSEVAKTYNRLIELGIPKEDARSVLPNATETKIIFTMNARTLLNFFKLRCCTRAEKPIRQMANEMLKQVKQIAPNIFAQAGASCVKGFCPEGEKTCGRLNKTKETI